MSGELPTTQAILQVALSGGGMAQTAQVTMLAAYSVPESRFLRTAEQQVLVAYDSHAVIRNLGNTLLVAYRTGPIENLKKRSWTFTLDGHTFYVLTLGEQGTYLYDLITGQWTQWITQGLNTWNMELGTTWRGGVVAGDQAEPIIWRMTPNLFIDDDFKPIKRVVTGALSIRNRDIVGNYSFRLTASLGKPVIPITDPATQPTVELETSDDQGKTFQSHGKLTMLKDKFSQTLQWLSLGMIVAPNRIFRVTDIGAIARIDGADAETDEDV